MSTLTGTIKTLNLPRAFGFIKGADGFDYFFHVTSLADEASFHALDVGMAVTFTETESDKGLRAVDVRVVGGG